MPSFDSLTKTMTGEIFSLKHFPEDSKNSKETYLELFLSLLKPMASISNLISSFKS